MNQSYMEILMIKFTGSQGLSLDAMAPNTSLQKVCTHALIYTAEPGVTSLDAEDWPM